MEIKNELRAAWEQSGWTVTKLAAVCGVTEKQARRWLRGESQPRLPQYFALRRALPDFARMVDRASRKIG